MIGLKQCKQVSEIVDNSAIAFLKILAKIHKSYKLDKYRKNVGLNKRIMNYSVKMGFGLHLGWAIEGAIGSTFKIDASYLSPHVNISGKLEEKTKDYGAQMIISGELVNYMSDNAKLALRVIDKVSFIEGQEMNIYTVDIDLQSLKIEDSPDQENDESNLLFKFQKRTERRDLLNKIMKCETNQWIDYEECNEDWIIMRSKYPLEFFEVYQQGFDNYLNGNWDEAKDDLEQCQRILGDTDRPSTRILAIMQKYGFVMPNEWNILRESH